MRLVFSEAPPDYSRYLYPYIVWAFPERGETPADFFARGFLPGSPLLDRFYLCRNLRVHLNAFSPSSENRRILGKFKDVEVLLTPRSEFDFSDDRRRRWLHFARERFGVEVMPEERLNRLMASPVVSHVLQFQVTRDGERHELGCVLMYLDEPRIAYYYYAFYELEYFSSSLGLYMMTSAVARFARAGYRHIHLGTCYTKSALYKIQFSGIEFFNGGRWSTDLDELKFMIRRNVEGSSKVHLLEDPDYSRFLNGGSPATHALGSEFRVD
ncbi:MAG: GNAT family N-acetyltransferase [Pedosphaera sp.]|nr:GNAT family N-acetyltransferase [Pedosphaera sp.]